MTVHHLSSDSAALDPTRTSMPDTGAVKPTSTKADSTQHIAPQAKDASDVSKLSRLMAKTAQDIKQDLQTRPAKVALARTFLEKGGDLSDQDIDATWDKMLPLV